MALPATQLPLPTVTTDDDGEEEDEDTEADTTDSQGSRLYEYTHTLNKKLSYRRDNARCR